MSGDKVTFVFLYSITRSQSFSAEELFVLLDQPLLVEVDLEHAVLGPAVPDQRRLLTQRPQPLVQLSLSVVKALRGVDLNSNIIIDL